MTQLTILHRGAIIGSAATVPHADAGPADDFEFYFLDFQPSRGYEDIRPAIRLASDALAHFGFLGPAADPESDAKARAAYVAAQALWAELELADDRGRPVAGRVVWFLEHFMAGQRSYWLDVELDDPAHTCRLGFASRRTTRRATTVRGLTSVEPAERSSIR